MTEYKLNHFTMADAQALAGKTADITEWDTDELEAKVTYPGARVTGIIVLSTPCLVIETAGAVITDAATGERLGTRPPEPELRLFFTWICEVDNVRGRFERGDRVALEARRQGFAREAPTRQPRQGRPASAGGSPAVVTCSGRGCRPALPAPGGPRGRDFRRSRSRRERPRRRARRARPG